MKYFILTLFIPTITFAYNDAKSYAQDRLDKYERIKSMHVEMYPGLESNSLILFDPNYQYGYIIGSMDAYRNMVNLLD